MVCPCMPDVPPGGGSQDGVWPQRGPPGTIFPLSTAEREEENMPAPGTASTVPLEPVVPQSATQCSPWGSPLPSTAYVTPSDLMFSAGLAPASSHG